MNYNEWAFHDIEPIYLQLVKKIEYAAFCGRRTPFYSSNGKIVKNQSQYRNESIYAPVSKRFNYFFQKRTLFCD
mgnify:CR=1 FL=1